MVQRIGAAMSITTYSELKTAIVDWMHRTDMTSYLDTFIDNAEADMNRELRMSEMESSTAVAVTTADLSLPDGFMEMREIHVSGSPDTVVEYATPYQLERMKTGETGKPRYYTITGDAIELYPYGSYTIDMTYYKSITPLDDTNTSNFVLTSHPSVYLHGCLLQACIWSRDVDGASVHGQEFNRLLESLNKTSKRRKFSGAPMQVMPA